MRRREFVVGLGVAAMPFVASAQQPGPKRRIGALMSIAESDSDGPLRRTAFEQGLQKLGWTNGRNVQIDYRWAAGDIDRMRAFATELVGLRPDVLLGGDTPTTAALQQATRTIPIVFALVSDPIGGGFVASFARPGGNIPGFITNEAPIAGKLLELLKQAAPQLQRVAFLYNPETASYAGEWLRYAETAGTAYAVELIAAPVHDDAEIEGAFGALPREPNGGVIIVPSAFTNVHRERIIALAIRHRLPAVSAFRYFVNSGGLISYSDDLADQYRQAAGYVGRILKGEKPADLPVQAPVRFELIVNLKTAKAIGLTIPESFLLRADTVIE